MVLGRLFFGGHMPRATGRIESVRSNAKKSGIIRGAFAPVKVFFAPGDNLPVQFSLRIRREAGLLELRLRTLDQSMQALDFERVQRCLRLLQTAVRNGCKPQSSEKGFVFG